MANPPYRMDWNMPCFNPLHRGIDLLTYVFKEDGFGYIAFQSLSTGRDDSVLTMMEQKFVVVITNFNPFNGAFLLVRRYNYKVTKMTDVFQSPSMGLFYWCFG
jgi:hypothetical protein